MGPICYMDTGLDGEIRVLIGPDETLVDDEPVAPENPRQFPFLIEQLEPSECGPYTLDTCIIQHEEAGWSWWDDMVAEIRRTGGETAVEACAHMRAWRGLAFPFDLPSSMIGDQFSEPVAHTITSILPSPWYEFKWLRRFMNKVRPQKGTAFKAQMDAMLHLRTGGSNVFRISSGTRILAELEAACDLWQLPKEEGEAASLAQKMNYEDPSSPQEVAHCYALMCRSFFRYAVPRKYIVWFIK